MTRKNVLLRARNRKAEALWRDNRLWEANAAYRELCAAFPLDADAWTKLALINRRLGMLPESERCAGRALAIDARHAPAHHALGAALQDQGRTAEAVDCYRAATALRPEFVDAHYFLGNALRELGRFGEAIDSYRRAVRLNPDYLEALSNLGALLKEHGRYGPALKLLRRAQRIDPSSFRVLCNLGGVLCALNRPEEGLTHFEAAVAINPDFFDAHLQRANTLMHLGRFDEALAGFRDAHKLRPDSPTAVAGIAEILEMRRELPQARALVGPLIEAGSLHPRALSVYAALAGDGAERASAASRLEGALASGRVDLIGTLHLHYALGKLYDRLGDYDKAFRHYDLAKRKTREIEAETFRRRGARTQTRQIGAWMEVPEGFWASLPRATHIDERPVFIVGMQRSGTTLAEQILASHPAVHGAGELKNLGEIAKTRQAGLADGGGYPLCLSKASAEALNAMAKRYLEHLDTLSPTALRVIDKMPGNFQRLGLISLLFPKARVIHMVRDPLDTCLSIYFQKFNTTSAYAFELKDLGAHYRAYRDLMRYWREALAIPILEVQYEALATDPERHIRKMVAFCGLEWNERCLRFYDTERDVNTPSYDQVRQPMYTRSIGRWKHYERHLGPLIEALQE